MSSLSGMDINVEFQKEIKRRIINQELFMLYGNSAADVSHQNFTKNLMMILWRKISHFPYFSEFVYIECYVEI